MESWEDRVLNGVLKSGVVDDPAEAQRLLSADIELVADPSRARTDLWACVWATAAALSREFSGRILIRCGLKSALPAPAALDSRCEFTTRASKAPIKVGLGVSLPEVPGNLWGDARGRTLSFARRLPQNEPAHPIAAFALAGYLSYAALARAVRLPSYRQDYTVSELTLPIPLDGIRQIGSAEITFIGLGQLGQAYLALLFFLTGGDHPGRVAVVDKDIFEAPNQSTQILLGPNEEWLGKPKASFLESRLRRLGWNAVADVAELTWEWRKPANHPPIAVLGLDDLEVRRMAISAGYEWIVESGVGTSFLEPRVSWHSLPPDPRLARELFGSSGDGERQGGQKHDLGEGASRFARQLKATPGECGWVTFNNVRATAPSMGVVASAYAWCSLLAALQGDRQQIQGRACLWSPLLPYWQELD